MIFNLSVIVLLLFSNGFFVASEFAMVKVRKTRVEQLVKEGNSNAKLALKAIEDLDKFIAAVQLGVTISSIGLGWVGEATLARIIEPVFVFLPGISKTIATHTISVTVAFCLITFLHVVLGELIPKSIALEYTEKTALWVARPMYGISFIFAPFIWLLNGFGNVVLKILNIPRAQKSSVHSMEELDMLVDASYNGGVLNETEKDMLHNMFKFSDLTAKQVMLPRTDMVCIPIDMSLEDLNKLAAESQYTRYPVYDDDIDHIVGIVHVKDLYSLSIKDEVCPIKNILRDVMLVPETITMDNLVIEFKKNKGQQMAIVIDEFGGTSGLITLEDVLEEIVGDVQDEFDVEEESDIKEISEDVYEANAMMRLDEFSEYFDFDNDIEEEDVDTIGGLVVKLLGRIAQVNDEVEFKNFQFIVNEIDGARVTKVKIVKLHTDKDVSSEDENS